MGMVVLLAGFRQADAMRIPLWHCLPYIAQMSATGSQRSLTPTELNSPTPSSSGFGVRSTGAHWVREEIPDKKDFELLLFEYSRSVIRSAMDHSHKEALALEENMTSTKEKVITKYSQAEATITALETALSKATRSTQQAEESNAILRADQARLNVDLKLEMEFTDDAKRKLNAQLAKENRDFRSWKEERARRQELEVVIATLKHDKKRKRENVAEIWEKVEKIKVNK
jgi:hypothetical protein